MLTWNEGAFSFHPGSDRGLPAIAFDLQNVMLEIMRLADETQGNQLVHLRRIDDRRR